MNQHDLIGIVYILLMILVIAVYTIITLNFQQFKVDWKEFKKQNKFHTQSANIVFWVCAIAIVVFTIVGLML